MITRRDCVRMAFASASLALVPGVRAQTPMTLEQALAGWPQLHSLQVLSGDRQVVLPVELTDDIMPGVVSMPHGWGHDRPGTGQTRAAQHPGASINDVLDDSQTDPVSGTSVLNGQTVTVRLWQDKALKKRA